MMGEAGSQRDTFVFSSMNCTHTQIHTLSSQQTLSFESKCWSTFPHKLAIVFPQSFLFYNSAIKYIINVSLLQYHQTQHEYCKVPKLQKSIK